MRQLLFAISFLTIVATLLVGCAAGTTAFDITRAPEMRIAGLRTIKLDEFAAGSSCQILILAPSPQIDSLYAKASSLSWAPELRKFPKYLRGALRDGTFKVTESDSFDARITGAVLCDLELQSRPFDTKNRDGTLKRQYQVERRVKVTAKFSVVKASGESFDSSVSASSGKSEFGDSVEVAASRLEDLHLFGMDGVMQETAEKLLRKISPHVVRERRRFAIGSEATIKDGNALAEKGNWQEAVQLWTRALQSTNESDRTASLQNLAIYDELQGKLGDALMKYEQIYTMNQDQKYQREVERVKSRMEEEKWLRDQYEGGGSAKQLPKHTSPR